MITSEKVRAARKEMQMKRLEAKAAGSPADDPESRGSYGEYYENQPLQLVKAAKNDEIRIARNALVQANEDLAVAEVTGEGLVAAQEAQAIAALVVEKLSAPDGAPVAQLSSAGSAA